MLPFKGPWGAPQPPIMLSLTVGVGGWSYTSFVPLARWCFPANFRAEHELQTFWSNHSRTLFLHHAGGIHVILFV
jgi:hypothetical protein